MQCPGQRRAFLFATPFRSALLARMGFLDRFSGKKPVTPSPAAPPPAAPEPAPVSETPPGALAGGVLPQLALAREYLESDDLPAALAIYDQVLAAAGDRADVLVTLSGDLGVTGHVREIIELVAPRYDAERHGPATGLNVLQAYLAEHDADAAQHVLDILFSLKRPELEERLHGFSNAIAELVHARQTGQRVAPAPGGDETPDAAPAQINLVSISKPIWFYGLEPLAPQLLPAKADRLRRIAFAQLAVLGGPDVAQAAAQPETELGRLSRALPLWLTETFYFSPLYAPVTAIGVYNQKHYALFGAEWTTDNLRQLVESTKEGLDYIFTGALRENAGDYELVLRVWEVKKFRERKQFAARWTPATADAELAQLHEQIRLFMEWSPEKTGLAYAPPASPRAWLDTLGASLSLFLADKTLLPVSQLADIEAILATAAAAAPTSEAASLAFLTLRQRAERLAVAARLEAALATSPLIAQARQIG